MSVIAISNIFLIHYVAMNTFCAKSSSHKLYEIIQELPMEEVTL